MASMIDDLCAFATLVDAGSFTQAAHQLGWSKGQLSKRLSAMEHEYGVQLLHRTTRRLSVTAAGAALLPQARALLEHSERARNVLMSLRDEPEGQVRITLPVSVGEAVFQPLFTFLSEHYPRLRVEVDLHNGYRDLLREGFDLAIRDQVGTDERLVARPFVRSVEVTCAAPAYLHTQGVPVSPESLVGHACLLNSHSASPTCWRYHRAHEPCDVQVGGPLAVNQYSLLRQAALKGAGIARLPSYLIADDLQAGHLVALLTEYQSREVPLYLVHAYTAGMPRRVTVVANWLKTWAQGL